MLSEHLRRSMRFAPHLVNIANDFRENNLASNDEKDDTQMLDLWENFQPERSESRGGPYMCVHLRRKDYVHSRKGQIPSLKGAAEQITRKIEELRAKGKHSKTHLFTLSPPPSPVV